MQIYLSESSVKGIMMQILLFALKQVNVKQCLMHFPQLQIHIWHYYGRYSQ